MLNPFRYNYVFFIVDEDPDKGLTACAAELVEAASDIEAIEIAEAAFDACDDAFHSYGLWQGQRRVTKSNHTNQLSQRFLRQPHNHKILDLLEELHDAYPILSRSQKLLRELKWRRGARTYN